MMKLEKKRNHGEWKDTSLNSWSSQLDKKVEIPSTNYNKSSFDYGYDMGKDFTLNEFKDMADEFERRWFRWELKEGEQNASPFQKEKEYWNIVENSEDKVTVQYGSDLDVEKHGSGFPLDPESKDTNVRQRALNFCKNCKSEYVKKNGWNTNNLPSATFLHHLGDSIAGVSRPMIYIGMLFSSFCWHVEDNFLYSINYLHTGNPKRWYGVPSYGAESFEDTMRNTLPDLFENKPNLLHLLVTMLSPRALKNSNVPVYTALQEKGQFVVTFPRSYHAGFNLGFNIAESVNFATEDWLPFCKDAVNKYRFLRTAVFPYEEFIIKASMNPDTPPIAKSLHNELEVMINKEEENHTRFENEGICKYYFDSEDYRQCEHCGYDCYLSGLTCINHPQQYCFLHHENMCNCPNSDKRIAIRIKTETLKKTLESLLEHSKKESIK